MARIKFHKTVIEHTPRLQALGYALDGLYSPNGEIVEFSKLLRSDVRCSIEFDIKNFFVPPVRTFSVMLFRTRLPNYGGPDNEYKPIVMAPEWFMRDKHGVSVFPPDVYIWQFISREGLQRQLREIDQLLITHMVDWLENPYSLVDFSTNSII